MLKLNWKEIIKEFLENKKFRSIHKAQLRELENVYGIKKLPRFSRYSMQPDVIIKILDTILVCKPEVIVELGSGSSTILIDAFLEKNNMDTLFYSIEHDKTFLKRIKNKLSREQSKLIFSPVTQYVIKEETWKWYSMDWANKVAKIDLLIIDGLPHYIQNHARYPALPLLINKLDQNSIIILDDIFREEEKEILRLWNSEFNLEFKAKITQNRFAEFSIS